MKPAGRPAADREVRPTHDVLTGQIKVEKEAAYDPVPHRVSRQLAEDRCWQDLVLDDAGIFDNLRANPRFQSGVVK